MHKKNRQQKTADRKAQKLRPPSASTTVKTASETTEERYDPNAPENTKKALYNLALGAAESFAPLTFAMNDLITNPYLIWGGALDGARRMLKGVPKLSFKIAGKQFDTQKIFYQDYLWLEKIKLGKFSFKFNKKSDDAVEVELEDTEKDLDKQTDNSATLNQEEKENTTKANTQAEKDFAENKEDAVKKELDLGATFSGEPQELAGKNKLSKDVNDLSALQQLRAVFDYGHYKNYKKDHDSSKYSHGSLAQFMSSGLVKTDELKQPVNNVDPDEEKIISPFKRDMMAFDTQSSRFENFKGKYVVHKNMPLDESAKNRGVLGQLWNNAKSMLDTRPRLRNHWVEYPLANDAVKLKQKHDAFNIAFDPTTDVEKAEHQAYAKHMVDTLKAQGFKSVHINLGKDENLATNPNSQQIIAAVMAYAQTQNMPVQSKNQDVKALMSEIIAYNNRPSATVVL